MQLSINKDERLLRFATRSQFAALIGVNIRTLQNWEQGRRTPHGPALALLKVAKSEPESVFKALRAA